MTVWIGTSGRQYDDWREAFYPREVPQRRWLEHYARRFQVVELNNTSTAGGRAGRVPRGGAPSGGGAPRLLDPRPCYAPQTLGSRLDDIAELWDGREDVFVFFNNDPNCCAVRDAELFAGACDRRRLARTRVPDAKDYRVWR
jgi:uncharacterized protein YecE (DUF72 family)